MKKTINTQARSVTFTFEGLDSITFNAEKMSAANYEYACLHGMAARIGDNAAIAKSAENNFTVTEAMRRAEVEKMVAFYEDANNVNWNMKVATTKAAPVNPFLMEVAKKRNCTYEEAMAWYNAKLMADLAAM